MKSTTRSAHVARRGINEENINPDIRKCIMMMIILIIGMFEYFFPSSLFILYYWARLWLHRMCSREKIMKIWRDNSHFMLFFFRFGWNRYDVLLWLFLVLERNRRISHEKVERNTLELVYNKFGEEIGVLVALFGKKWHELAFDGNLFREVVNGCC